jgi:hypothetical protein
MSPAQRGRGIGIVNGEVQGGGTVQAILSMWSALGTNKGKTRRVANPKKEGPEIPGLLSWNNAADEPRS